MKKFIQPTKKTKKNIDTDKIDSFIGTFNGAIKKGEFSLNTGLSHIPYLNDGEFLAAKIQAIKNGYNLTVSEDNYQTVTYKLELIK